MQLDPVPLSRPFIEGTRRRGDRFALTAYHGAEASKLATVEVSDAGRAVAEAAMESLELVLNA